jgi:large subunit ribosomal protein L28
LNLYLKPFLSSVSQQRNIMSRICAITGKRPVKGGRIIRKGLTKKSGGIGTSLVKNTKRRFKPNVQRIRVRLASGQVKRMWVAVKAIKAGKVQKA